MKKELQTLILPVFLSKRQCLISLAAYDNTQHPLTTAVWLLAPVEVVEEVSSHTYLFVKTECNWLVPQCHEEISSVHLILQMGNNHVNYQPSS